MNIASAAPQSIGPPPGAFAVLATGSFTLVFVFVLGAVFAFGGALAVSRVRSVR